MAHGWDAAGTQASAQFQAELAQKSAALPEFAAVLTGEVGPLKRPPSVPVPAPPVDKPTANAGTKGSPGPAAPSPSRTAVALAAPIRGLLASLLRGRASTQVPAPQKQQEAKRAIQQLGTQLPPDSGRLGLPPKIPLQGEQDPQRIAKACQQADQEVARTQTTQAQKILHVPGGERVHPLKLEEKVAAKGALGQSTLAGLEPVQGMHDFTRLSLAPNVIAAFDQLGQSRMTAHLAEPRAELEKARDTRERESQRAINETRTRVLGENQRADAAQRAQVQNARGGIEKERGETLNQQQRAAGHLRERAANQHSGAVRVIDARVQTDQAQLAQRYQQAEAQAAAARQRAEQDARQHRESAEKEAEDQGFFSRAWSAVCDAISKIGELIDGILSAAQRFISGLLDAAKEFACHLIDRARDFINQQIQRFGDWLKEQVNALLGQIFPELAARLNAFIDRNVAAAQKWMNAQAETLKQKVRTFVDGLKERLNAAIGFFRRAVQFVSKLAGALMRGDWREAGRMVLEGVLSILGIDPAEFYRFIGQAETVISALINNPGQFVSNLASAVRQGFEQFGKNILQHLKKSLLDWLFGEFKGQGIQMPQRFDAAGLFDLVCQVLGLTYPKLRQKAVKLVGEKNTKRVEKVWQYVESLLTGGWAGLWDRIAQNLSNLWDTVVDGVREYLVEELIKQALFKLATMWNPLGALLQLVKMAWNLFCWLRENAQRILGIVQAVVGSMQEIVTGNIQRAADGVESSLGQVLTAAISLVAELAGVGGIVNRVRDIINKLRTEVDQALDALIERIARGLGANQAEPERAAGQGRDGAADPAELRVSFEMAGESHNLFFRPGHHGEEIEMASHRGRLSAKIGRSVAGLVNRKRAAVAGQRHEEAAKLETQAADLIQVGRAATAVQKDAEKLAEKPKEGLGAINTLTSAGQIPGFEKLALTIRAYGDKYKAHDIEDLTKDELGGLAFTYQRVQEALNLAEQRPLAPDWVALFATGGQELRSAPKAPGQQGQVLTLRKIWNRSKINSAIEQVRDAILNTLAQDPKYLDERKADGVHKLEDFDQLAEDRAEKIVNDMVDVKLQIIGPTAYPRSVKKGPLVRCNPEAERTSQALYHSIAKNSQDPMLSELAGQLHHIIPLYLGGSHREDNLMRAEGLAKVAGTAHGIMHELLDSTSIAKFLGQADNDITLKWSDLAKILDPQSTFVYIGELVADGRISYQKAMAGEGKAIKLARE